MSAFNQMNSYLRFCIDYAHGHEVRGRLFSQRFTQPVEFTDLADLGLFLEEVFDVQKYPQAFQSARTIVKHKSDLSCVVTDPNDGMASSVVREAHGSVTTFDIVVTSRRRSTWQGSINWLSGEEAHSFSSYLTLMHLIHHRLFPESIRVT